MNRHAPTMHELRRELVGDSRSLEKAMQKFVALVRADERAKTLATLNRTRDRAESEAAR